MNRTFEGVPVPRYIYRCRNANAWQVRVPDLYGRTVSTSIADRDFGGDALAALAHASEVRDRYIKLRDDAGRPEPGVSWWRRVVRLIGMGGAA